MVTPVPYSTARRELEQLRRQLADLDRLDRQNYEAFVQAKRLQDQIQGTIDQAQRQLPMVVQKVTQIRGAARRYRADMAQLRARISALERSGVV